MDVAERELGPIPQDFPQASFQVHNGDDDIQVARRAWADNVMAALLDIGTARRQVIDVSRPLVGGPGADEEPSAQPPIASDMFPYPSMTPIFEAKDTFSIPFFWKSIHSSNFRGANQSRT